jgi:hypothetical protein
MEVRSAWVVIILPSELYEQVQRGKEEDVDLRQVIDNLERDVVTVDLKDGGFLSEIIKRYSGCDNVSDDLVRRVMDFDSYTLVAKYVGTWLRERGCKVEDVDKALRESAGQPKLFFANYLWSTVLGENEDLARRVSVPLILHATFGPIPEGITYITKAVNKDGTWKLIDRNELAESKLEDLREADLEPIAKWLSTLHEDLIEETLQELVGLHGEEARNNYRNHGFEGFINALDWGYKEALGEGREILGPEISSLLNPRMNLPVLVITRSMSALKPLTNCWKRAALIIGYALTGHPTVLRPGDSPESLRRDVAESLGDALRECDVDYYLLVGNEIPPLIIGLVIVGLGHTLALIFIDKYNEAVAEANRIINIARGRYISDAERLYGLGLASIIANAARLVRDVDPGEADIALRIALFAIQSVASPDLIKLVLSALKPLRDKAPHRYLELLVLASNMENLDRDTFRYILKELNKILDNHGGMVKEHVWSLVYAIIAYANLLWLHRVHFDNDEVKGGVGRIADLLNELGKIKTSLGVIAWAYALAPALEHRDVRGLMEEKIGIDVVGKASEVLEELNDMRERVQDLMRDEEFRSYVESRHIKADEEAVRRSILDALLRLRHVLALYWFDNDELDKAEELINENTEKGKEIGDYQNYLISRSWALRVEAIKGSLVAGKLVDEFRRLYEETFNKKPFMRTAKRLNIASATLSNYLVSLALTGNYEKINELLEEHLWVLNAVGRASVLTRLTLNALLRPRGRLSSELEGKLSVNPEELINAFEYDMHREFLPALRVAFKMISPEEEYEECKSIKDSMKRRDCEDVVSAVTNDSDAVWRLRGKLIDYYNKQILEKESSGWLGELGFDANELISEFEKLVYGLDGKSLAQLLAIRSSMAQLALMLRALINGNKELAKALALRGAIYSSSKLLGRLFLEAYKECCDLGNDEFWHALARLFFYHI